MAQTVPIHIHARERMRFWRALSKPGMKLFYMALPFFVFIFIFNYLPLYGWLYSFFDFQFGGKITSQQFVGMDFFKRMFSPGSTFLTSIINTLAMSFLSLVLAPIPVIFALFLAEMNNSKLSRLVQTVTSLPNFISWVLVFAFSFVMFSSQGVINTLFIHLNLIKEPMNVLANGKIVWYFQALLGLWKTLGWSAIIYIAALSSVDKELYDAAEVDGAGRFAKIWNISIPGIMPTFVVILFLSVGNLLNAGFEQYYVFRNPLVSEKIDVLDIYIYISGISNFEFSYATAVGMYKSLISIFLIFVVNYVIKKVSGRSII